MAYYDPNTFGFGRLPGATLEEKFNKYFQQIHGRGPTGQESGIARGFEARLQPAYQQYLKRPADWDELLGSVNPFLKALRAPSESDYQALIEDIKRRGGNVPLGTTPQTNIPGPPPPPIVPYQPPPGVTGAYLPTTASATAPAAPQAPAFQAPPINWAALFQRPPQTPSFGGAQYGGAGQQQMNQQQQLQLIIQLLAQLFGGQR